MFQNYFSTSKWLLVLLSVTSFSAVYCQPRTLATIHPYTAEELVSFDVVSEEYQGEPLKADFSQIGAELNLNLKQNLKEFDILELDRAALAELRERAPYSFEMTLPRTTGPDLKLDLVAVKIFGRDFSVMTSEGEVQEGSVPGYHYWGVIKEEPGSWVALSVFEDQFIGVLQHPSEGTMTLGLDPNGSAGQHVLYRNRDELYPESFSSGTKLSPMTLAEMEALQKSSPDDEASNQESEGRRVEVHLESDFAMYQAEGSVKACADKMAAMMNAISLLYANEGVRIWASELKVWTSPDGVSGASVQESLDAYSQRTPSFKGDLACFLSAGPATVGAANVGSIGKAHEAGGPYAYCNYTMKKASYPNYAPIIKTIANELGHVLGAQHTLWSEEDLSGQRMEEVPIGGNDFSRGFAPQAREEIQSFVLGAYALNRINPWDYLEGEVINIQSILGRKYVCAERRGTKYLIANRTQARSWERFRVAFPYDDFTFKALINNKYVKALSYPNDRILRPNNSSNCCSSTQFKLRAQVYGSVSLYSRGARGYVSYEGGVAPMIANRSAAYTWEFFYLLQVNNKRAEAAPVEDDEAVTLYPNPASEVLQVKGVAPEDVLDVYNVQGQRLIQTTGVSSLDVAHLASGMYFLKVNDGQTIRFVKQ